MTTARFRQRCLDRPLPGVVAFTLALCILGSQALLLGACASRRGAPATGAIPLDQLEYVRGLWITRWDYRSPSDIERAIDDAASLGITDIYFQVRGQGDAYYRSSLEPAGVELVRTLGGDPGFDPLGVAVDRARSRGIRLHAWINVMPIWRGTEPPDDRSHPMRANPQWRLADASGAPEPLHDGYVIANPALPEVREHLASIASDIVARYDVDGLHLDYIRFVGDPLDSDPIRPADPRTLALFREQTGRAGIDTSQDRTAYRDWLREQITRIVEGIARSVRTTRPGVELSAAVWRRPDLARDAHLQDAARWVELGLVDRILPMIYTEDHAQFLDDLEAWQHAVPRPRLTPGLGVYKHRPPDTPRQIALASGPGGYALFAYSSIFESSSRFQERGEDHVAQRTAIRRVLTELSRRFAGVDPS